MYLKEYFSLNGFRSAAINPVQRDSFETEKEPMVRKARKSARTARGEVRGSARGRTDYIGGSRGPPREHFRPAVHGKEKEREGGPRERPIVVLNLALNCLHLINRREEPCGQIVMIIDARQSWACGHRFNFELTTMLPRGPRLMPGPSIPAPCTLLFPTEDNELRSRVSYRAHEAHKNPATFYRVGNRRGKRILKQYWNSRVWLRSVRSFIRSLSDECTLQ